MSSSENNLAIVAAAERALIFKPIEEKLLSLKNNKSLGLSFEKNTISNKNDAVTINTGALRISVRAFVSKNPNTGAVINLHQSVLLYGKIKIFSSTKDVKHLKRRHSILEIFQAMKMLYLMFSKK